MKLMVTGATGFIGRELIYSKQSLDEILALTRNSVDFCQYKKFRSLFDITASDIAGGDVFIHLAGLAHKKYFTRSQYQEINTDLAIHLANVAVEAGFKRFIFVSTIGVNGLFNTDGEFTHNSTPNPHNDYASSKYKAEEALLELSSRCGLEVVIIRPTLVYGKNAPGNFHLLKKLVGKLPALPFGLLNNKRSFIAVENLVDLIFTCTKNPAAANKIFLASDGNVISIKDFTNAVAIGLGKKIIQLPIPLVVMKFFARLTNRTSLVEQLFSDLEVDSSYVFNTLNWTPPVSMREAMAKLKESNND